MKSLKLFFLFTLALLGSLAPGDLPDFSNFMDRVIPYCKSAPKAPQLLSRMKLETAFEVGFQGDGYRCGVKCGADIFCSRQCQMEAGVKMALSYFEDHPNLIPSCEVWTSLCESRCEESSDKNKCKNSCKNQKSV